MGKLFVVLQLVVKDQGAKQCGVMLLLLRRGNKKFQTRFGKHKCLPCFYFQAPKPWLTECLLECKIRRLSVFHIDGEMWP